MTRLLDILEDFLMGVMGASDGVIDGHPLFYRLDGKTSLPERQRLIDDFNRPECKSPPLYPAGRVRVPAGASVGA
eukprot:9477618-Pyramimonas_sp.AAC.1